MKRLYIFLMALLALPAAAQTTLDITVPGPATCSYITGPVTNEATPGHLQATATSSSGAGCGTGGAGNVTFGPASPLSPQATTLPSNTGTVNFSFQALNASTCTATITGAATGSFTGGSTLCSGTGSSTCSNRLVTAPASFTNTGSSSVIDTVTLTCTGTSGQAQSVATVTVPSPGQPPPPGSCSTVVNGTGAAGVTRFTSQGQATVLVGGHRTPETADMSSFASVFGGFPGRRGDVAYDTLPISNYISMQFSMPSGYVENAPAGYYQYLVSMNLTDDDTRVSMTISTTCGDFSPTTDSGSTVVKNCYKNGVKADGGIQVWAQGDPATQCILSDLTPYYLNIINADISGVTSSGGSAASYRDGPGSGCAGKSACSVPMVNGPFINYPQFP
jgi:hypothetical protein